jgi:hypothetical protein
MVCCQVLVILSAFHVILKKKYHFTLIEVVAIRTADLEQIIFRVLCDIFLHVLVFSRRTFSLWE